MGMQSAYAFVFAVVLSFVGVSACLAQDAAPQPAPTAQAQAAPQIGSPEASSGTEPLSPEVISTLQNAIGTAKERVQDDMQPLPEPARPVIIQSAAARGSQVTYMGTRNNFTGWLLMTKGVPTYVYVSLDEQTIFQGLMFDGAGAPVSLQQVAEAQMRNPELFEGQPIVADPGPGPAPTQTVTDADGRRPGEVLYDALSVANFVTLGAKTDGAPVVYAFIDPECPHCKEFLRNVDKPYLQSQRIQLRILPIGLGGENGARQAAWILSQPNGGEMLLEHARSGKAIPTPSTLTLDGQQLNIDLFRLWKFDGTPILVYRAANGTVMMVRGKPNNFDDVYNSLSGGGQ